MTTLGDSLLAKGQLYAAQFCYIVSVAEWGTFAKKGSKLVLLCAQVSPRILVILTCNILLQVGDLTVDQFATTEAIQCTEVFEFVRRLADPDFCMPRLSL